MHIEKSFFIPANAEQMMLHWFLLLIVLQIPAPLFSVSNGDFPTNIFAESHSAALQADPGEDTSRSDAENLIHAIERASQPQYAEGFRLLKLVTAEEFSDLYQKSCELYLQGLGQDRISNADLAILKEDLLYLKPFFGRREANGYDEMAEQKNPEIFEVLQSFWEERDLTPSDSYNERLMEHWQRVHYALNNFNTTSRALYDDRGGIHIKFGKPGKKRNGIFMYNPGFANYIIATRMDDGRGGVSDAANAINTTLYLNTLYQVREYHQYPSFETWVYENLTDHSESVIYLFGNTHGGNEMNLKKSVDDFVPSAAYSMTERNSPVSMSILGGGGGDAGETETSGGDEDGDTNILNQFGGGDLGSGERISPALVLQFMYYRQLASLDHYFSAQYEEMLNRYMDTSIPISRSLARQFQQTNSARLLIANNRAPDEYSSGNDEMFNIGTTMHAYRFYDEELSPELRLYFLDQVEEAVSFDQLKRFNSVDSISYDDYEIVRTLEIEFDEEISDNVSAVHRAAEELEDPLWGNVIRIPLKTAKAKIRAVSELHNTRVEDGAIREGSVFRERIKGISSSDVSVERPDINKDGFFTSDVILGYRENGDSGDVELAHDRQIPENSAINFFYESYNLSQNPEGLFSFALTYTIQRDRSAVGNLLRFWKNEQTSMTITNTNDRPVFDQMLEIVTEKLDPGTYNLILDFSEQEESPVLYSKEIRFRITEEQ